jgi:amidase
MHRGLTLSHSAWIRADDRRLELRRGWRKFFSRYDALICLSQRRRHTRIKRVSQKDQYFLVNGEKRPAANNYYWIGLPNLAYLPATAVPIGSHDGIPIGAQIMGPEFGDKRCLRLARIIIDVPSV